MAKRSTSPGGREPWQLQVEDALRDRPGVTWISLLTDEAGARWIARGEVPGYMRQQAIDALAWCATDERAGAAERAALELRWELEVQAKGKL